MGGHAVQNTNPSELGRRLQVSGPMGFIAAVHTTLQHLERPYYFADAPPEFLLANKDASAQGGGFEQAYRKLYGEGEHPKSFVATPHAIIHQYRKRPAKLSGRGTTDSKGHLRRQTVPHEAIYHDRPLPDSEPLEEIDYEYLPWDGDDRRPPLWESEEHIPDIIKPYVKEKTLMYVTKWHYDVYVDFVCLATTGTWVEQMTTDLDLILHTFHHRSQTGSSNLHGWHVETITGTPVHLQDELYDGVHARTISWRLRQTVGIAMPAHMVRKIMLDVHGYEDEEL